MRLCSTTVMMRGRGDTHVCCCFSPTLKSEGYRRVRRQCERSVRRCQVSLGGDCGWLLASRLEYSVTIQRNPLELESLYLEVAQLCRLEHLQVRRSSKCKSDRALRGGLLALVKLFEILGVSTDNILLERRSLSPQGCSLHYQASAPWKWNKISLLRIQDT